MKGKDVLNIRCHLKLLVITLLAFVIFSGCKIPFTHQMRYQHDLSYDELMQLQYYVSQPIVLHREVPSEGANVAKGKLITKSGKLIDEVIVKKGTPGIAVEVDVDEMAIAFEEGTYLRFGSPENGHFERGGKYVLLAREWFDDVGILMFDGEYYEAIEKSGYSYLLIDKDSLSEIIRKKRVLEGLKIK